MHAKKLLSLLLSALAAVTLLASCGSRWDYSREAVKAANEVQGETLRVEFQIDQKFTNALHDAVEENIQPADVEKAMLADASLKELLTSGYRLNVYALRADVDAEEAARTIAEEQILPRLSGCKDEGVISMVKADNNYFYEAVLTYNESSSGGGGGDHEPGKPEEPDPQPIMYEVTIEINDETLGTVTTDLEGNTVEEGGSFTFTVTPKNENVEVTVSVSGTRDFDEETYTVSNVQSDITITVVFEEKEEEYPVQWYENASKDGKYEAGTLIFRKGASDVMGNKILTLDAAIKGLKAGQYAANPTAAENFSFQDVVHLIVEENSGVTEIKGYTETEAKEVMISGDLSDTFWGQSGSLRIVELYGVETVGAMFFYGSNVEDITLYNRGNISIGYAAFAGSKFLVNINIEAEINLVIGKEAFSDGFVTGSGSTATLKGENIEIGEAAFELAHELSDITFSGKITNVGEHAFDQHGDLTIHYQPGADEFATHCPESKLENVGLKEENFA